jgi:small GTP-binding protein
LTLNKKVVLLGDSAVGKTSLIRRYVFNQLESSYDATIGCKVTSKEIKILGPKKMERIRLMIWDLIGSKGYHALHARTFVGVNGAILVSDLSRRETLESLEEYWIPSLYNIVDEVPLVFICNKSDMKGRFEFEYEDLEDITERYNVSFDGILPSDMEYCYSTSAKYGGNVEKAFESMVHLVIRGEESSNPVNALYESLVATGICRSTDKTTPIGVLDAIIVDFCEGFGDTRVAMLILRREISRAGINISYPTKWGICKVIEYLAEAENEFLDEEIVQANLERRFDWTHNIEAQRYVHKTKDAFETLRPSI